jgi:adenylosuccinate synthase
MLDFEMESYLYITSSTTTIAGVIGGLALYPRGLTEAIDVVKVYTTRVGPGAFKTEDRTLEELASYPADLDNLGRADFVYHEMPA